MSAGRARRLPALAAVVCLALLLRALLRGEVGWVPAFLLSVSLLWLLHGRCSGRPWRERPACSVFLASLAVYLSTFHWH